MRKIGSQLNNRAPRKRTRAVFLIALCVSAFWEMASTCAQGTAQGFQAALAERLAAYRSGDKAKVNSFLAADVVFKVPGGKTLSRKDWDVLVAISTPPSQLRQENEVMKTQWQKDTASALVKFTESYEARLKDGSTGSCVTVSKRREHWKYNGQQWRIQIIELFRFESQTLNGKKRNDLFYQVVSEVPLVASYQDYLSGAERDWLQQGKSLFFVYRMKDGAFLVRPPIFLDDQRLAEFAQGHTLKIKVEPGEHRFKSDTEDVVSIKAEGGKIYHFELSLNKGFPKGRGKLSLDTTLLGLQFHLLPVLHDLPPLEDKHIDDLSKVIK